MQRNPTKTFVGAGWNTETSGRAVENFGNALCQAVGEVVAKEDKEAVCVKENLALVVTEEAIATDTLRNASST